jgi:tRNA (mo5U34)-methyltransferase
MPTPPSLSDAEVRERIASVPHWYHRIELRPGVVTPGITDASATLDRLDLPADLSGLRALDIGARDGFFSFELERRGAEVVAIDYMDPAQTGFPVASEVLGSGVAFQVENVYDLDPERHGLFDIVLFLGVLYHLRDPLLALDRIWDVCAEGATVAVETQVLDHALLLPDGTFRELADYGPDLADTALAQFYPGSALRGDMTNYWAPSGSCLRGLMQEAGFDVTGEAVDGSRAIFHGRHVRDPGRDYYRRLEKTTPAAAAGAAAGVPTARGDDTGQLQAALASAQYRQRAADDELGEAKRYIASLEETLKRKDTELEASIAENARLHRAPVPPAGPPAGLLRRVAAALDRHR